MVGSRIRQTPVKYLDGWNEARRRAAQRYNELLMDLPVTTPYESPDSYHVYHQYTIRAPQRDTLAAYLRERGIGTMIYYPVSLHLQGLYASLGCILGHVQPGRLRQLHDRIHVRRLSVLRQGEGVTR